jgi:hypothetical protein
MLGDDLLESMWESDELFHARSYRVYRDIHVESYSDRSTDIVLVMCTEELYILCGKKRRIIHMERSIFHVTLSMLAEAFS